MAKRLMIGEMAKRTGTKVNTIRFYEDIGVLPAADRSSSGRRTYGERDVERLSFVRHARALGFSIDKIRSLIALAEVPDGDCAEAGAIAQVHLADVEARIAKLQILRDELSQVATSCAGGASSKCRVIELIAKWHEEESATS